MNKRKFYGLILIGLMFLMSGCVSTLIEPNPSESRKHIVSDYCEIKGKMSGDRLDITLDEFFYLRYLDTDTSDFDVRVFLSDSEDIAYGVDEKNHFIGSVYFKGNRWYHKSNITSDCDVAFVELAVDSE